MSTPHGAGVLPGEDLAAQCVVALEQAELAIERGDAAALVEAGTGVAGASIPEGVPVPLRAAIERMLHLCGSAAGDPAGTLGAGAGEWLASAAAARRTVVRMSLELRLVVSVAD